MLNSKILWRGFPPAHKGVRVPSQPPARVATSKIAGAALLLPIAKTRRFRPFRSANLLGLGRRRLGLSFGRLRWGFFGIGLIGHGKKLLTC